MLCVYVYMFMLYLDFGLNFLEILVFLYFRSSNSIAGESALDRLACGLGGKTMLPHILNSIPQMLANSKYTGQQIQIHDT